MEINRRDFVKLLGGSLFGLAIGSSTGAILRLPNRAEPILYSGPRLESWKLSACTKCPGGCSLKVRLIDELPIQAFGNPKSPVNEGGICSLGLVSVADLYHPSRLTGPVRKVDGEFKPLKYEEAYRILFNHLEKSITQNRHDDVFFVAQTTSKLRASLFREFSNVTGFKNLIVDNFQEGSYFPFYKVANESPDFVDFDSCDYLLNFGAQLTEISENPIYFTRKLNEYRAKGHKVVAIQSRLTPSVSKLDDWIPLSSNVFGDLALGIAYVLLKDEQYDKHYVENNFSEFADFKAYVLKNYIPEKVAESTGIPAETILKIGREFEMASVPIAYFDESVLYSSNGTENAFAIIALNALRGFAGFAKIKNNLFGELFQNKNPEDEKVTFSTLFKKLSIGQGVQTLMISGSNFIFNSINSKDLEKQLKSIPFIVSFSSFVDETSSFADLIIPDHCNFEKLDLLIDESMGKPIATIQQPIVEPFFKTVDTSDIIISLMKQLRPKATFSYRNYSDYVELAAKKIYSAKQGIFINQNKPTVVEKGLREIGWQTEQFGSFDDFWDRLMDSGGWWDPLAEKKLYNPKVDIKLLLNKKQFPSKDSPSSASGNKLLLNVYKRNLDYKGNMSIYPTLVEQFGSGWSIFYQLWAEINPETARRLLLKDRSKLIVETAKGMFPVVLVYNPTVVPGNLDIPFGLGHTVLGDSCGVNPLNYLDDKYDKFSGNPTLSETIGIINGSSSNSGIFSFQKPADQDLNREKDTRRFYA